jgi:DDE superfamily endonuclease
MVSCRWQGRQPVDVLDQVMDDRRYGRAIHGRQPNRGTRSSGFPGVGVVGSSNAVAVAGVGGAEPVELRWLRHRLDVRTLAAEAGVSIATGYRYLHEALDIIAAHAPDLEDVLAQARAAGLPFVCLDGTPVPTDRVAARAERGHHVWYSGKHHAFGGNVQVLADPTGFPLWVSAVRPGSTHGLTAARELVLPALYPHAARGLPVLADKGYTGAGVGVHVPVRHHPDGPLHIDNRCFNQLVTALRAPTERSNALLGRWRALDRVTVCPQRISASAPLLPPRSS